MEAHAAQRLYNVRSPVLLVVIHPSQNCVEYVDLVFHIQFVFWQEHAQLLYGYVAERGCGDHVQEFVTNESVNPRGQVDKSITLRDWVVKKGVLHCVSVKVVLAHLFHHLHAQLSCTQ